MLKIKRFDGYRKQPTLGNLKRNFMQFLDTTRNNSVIIAGGFVRDLIHNKPFKDMDIHIPNCRHVTPQTTLALFNAAFNCDGKLELYEPDNLPKHYQKEIIHQVYRIVGAVFPVDIIVLRTNAKIDAIDVISEFDISLNQAAIRFNPGIGYQLVYNDCKMVSPNPDVYLNKERIERLSKKYPEYQWLKVNKQVALQDPKNVPKDKRKAFEEIFFGQDVAVNMEF